MGRKQGTSHRASIRPIKRTEFAVFFVTRWREFKLDGAAVL